MNLRPLIDAATPGRYTVENNGEGMPVLWRWVSPGRPVMVTAPTATLTVDDLRLISHLLNLAMPALTPLEKQ